MKTAILDTNFIMTCVKQKIDFVDEIRFMGMNIIVPKQVINELKRIVNSKKKLHDKEFAVISLKILEKEKKHIKKADLKKYGKNTDNALKNFSERNSEMILATLDKELKKKTKNNKLVIRAKKKLEII
tara:strand:+ start:218 stop:601 length:384 start_codon:yes stop_codon:yes gene_type:complete